jgi:hypothetical protein
MKMLRQVYIIIDYRYYSSETGLYLSQDPIRLAGNNLNFYEYDHDCNYYVDTFGLNSVVFSEQLSKKLKRLIMYYLGI